jgi:hypothetical protein
MKLQELQGSPYVREILQRASEHKRDAIVASISPSTGYCVEAGARFIIDEFGISWTDKRGIQNSIVMNNRNTPSTEQYLFACDQKGGANRDEFRYVLYRGDELIASGETDAEMQTFFILRNEVTARTGTPYFIAAAFRRDADSSDGAVLKGTGDENLLSFLRIIRQLIGAAQSEVQDERL